MERHASKLRMPFQFCKCCLIKFWWLLVGGIHQAVQSVQTAARLVDGGVWIFWDGARTKCKNSHHKPGLMNYHGFCDGNLTTMRLHGLNIASITPM